MKKNDKAHKSLRVTEKTHELLVKIADKEGLSMGGLIGEMAKFFTQNSIGVTEEVDTNLSSSIEKLRKEMSSEFSTLNKRITTTKTFLMDPVYKTILALFQNIVPSSTSEKMPEQLEAPSDIATTETEINATNYKEFIKFLTSGWSKVSVDTDPKFRKTMTPNSYQEMIKKADRLLEL